MNDKIIPDINNRPRPFCLVILDGFGVAPPGDSNAIYLAATPNLDSFRRKYPYTTLAAGGLDVGLPAGQMGNSEVGHLNIGAGRIVYQELTRINQAIEDGSFLKNEILRQALTYAKKEKKALHLLGLLSDGGVHSHNSHLYALLEMAAAAGLNQVFVHIFLDGRDVPPHSALGYIEQLEDRMAKIGIGRVATVTGRYYAMDRDKRWPRTKMAYDALVYGNGIKAETAARAVEESYEEDVFDEFVQPTVVETAGDGRVKSGDTCIFFNFRSDRARQLTRAFTDDKFVYFDRGPRPPQPFFVCLTEYDIDIAAPVAFPPADLPNTLADVIANAGLSQFHTAETEKYAHVTFFFNGGVEAPKPGEERLLIPSPKVATYDSQPEMSAFKVGDAVCRKVAAGASALIVVNFANSDMVGHTGIMGATVKAIKAIDKVVGRVVACVRDQGGELIIMADHGNAEKMVAGGGKPWTAHTSNQVPCYYITDKPNVKLRPGGRLADVAPTILKIMGLPIPKEMTGKSLVI